MQHKQLFCQFNSGQLCDALGDLVPFVQFKKTLKNTHGGALILEPATLLKLTLLHGCLSHFLNCTNGTKSRNASHSWICIQLKGPKTLLLSVCLSVHLSVKSFCEKWIISFFIHLMMEVRFSQKIFIGQRWPKNNVILHF